MAAGPALELPAAADAVALGFLLLSWGFCVAALWAYRRSLKRIIVGLANIIDVSVLGRHPLGGVSAWIKAQAQNIDHLLGEGAIASERGAVVLFKLFLNLQVWIAGEIANLATDVWHGLGHVERRTVNRITKVVTHTVVKPLRTSVTVVRGVSATVSAQLNARLRTLDAKVTHLTHTLAVDVATLPARVGVTPKQLRRDARRLSALEKKTVGLGAVALVTAAFARMGWRWIKCDSAKSVGRRLNCGSFRFLESLLALAIDTLVITHLCATTKLLTRVATSFEPVLNDFTTGIVSLMKCQGSSRPPDMTIRGAALPTLEASRVEL